MKKAIAVIIFIASVNLGYGQLFETITFPSLDSLEMTADLYVQNKKNAPFIIMCHQSESSRGEYLAIAPLFLEKGFNCMAIDQRCGLEYANTFNETYYQGGWNKKIMNYLTSEQDILAAIEYVKTNYPKTRKLILWGSSYSASLCLKIASDDEDIDAVIAFSPGEYFKSLGKSDDYLQNEVSDLECRTLITCGKNEIERTKIVYDAIPSKKKTFFVPKGNGAHGSKAFYSFMPDNEEYREAVYKFLKKTKRRFFF